MMKNKDRTGVVITIIAIIGMIIGVLSHVATKRIQNKAKEENQHVPYGPYEALYKRPLDVTLSVIGMILLSPVYLITALLVKKKLGSPVIFTQERPGKIDPKTGKEKIFRLYKFRSMTEERDDEGKLLPDEVRLTDFGKKLRSTSVDELPELYNILKNDMSLVGPRPQLVRDLVFMTEEQRKRHVVKPGLTGLAQVNGRNAVTWEQKFDWDLKYVDNISFIKDMKIIGLTFKKVFGRREASEELDVTDDFGDELLKSGSIAKERYDLLQLKARTILEQNA